MCLIGILKLRHYIIEKVEPKIFFFFSHCLVTTMATPQDNDNPMGDDGNNWTHNKGETEPGAQS